MKCRDCGFNAKNAAGMSSHRRAKHPESRTPDGGPMAVAMENTLGELRRVGRFADVDAARVQALRTMASALDDNPFNSQMWRELRESLNEVMAADDDADDALAAALAQISGGTAVGDPPEA